MPKKLVRTSDMQVVSGLQVNEGYCALSYSWNQSGDSVVDEFTGKEKRDDQGKHKIVYPAKKIRQKPRGRKRIPHKVRLVKFEGLIQQICKDFNIKYIWYDQMCINQDDMEEKREEIRHMHRIYSNAYCTVALVPELQVRKYISKRTDILYSECTKEHDRVFALANIFPEVMSKITVDYDQSLHDLLIQFYGALAEHDLSVLCFKRRGYSRLYKSIAGTHPTEADPNYIGFPLESHRLPSWTGVAGEHYQMGQLKTNFQNYCINGGTLEVTCIAVTNNNRSIAPPLVFESTDIPPIPKVKAQGVYYLAIIAQLPDYGTKTVYLISERAILDKAGIQALSKKCSLLSFLLPIKKENLCWLDRAVEKDHTLVDDINLTEDISDTSRQLVMLSEISFPVSDDFTTCYYPVVKKDGDHYKAIGICILDDPELLLAGYTPAKQTYRIQ
ncbi:heterokaryon incompatibility protein-domain-containing protein [Zychaea mexicana]|uniref:heterokaryon incompatibility protein-domain-containing protein n=1 Tax=Zychaea mexicana TaxID=64656 RepID=UPI0022FF0BCC|nr:heterokaryon incompatibility protein-domain-containing protein [Zychaea mexicana]KAI9495977.1 heterokaryon incompatibility protein-domain-containing protein [Zychaea mexicana]